MTKSSLMGKTPHKFCTSASIASSLKSLNSELNTLDVPLIPYKVEDLQVTLVQLINVCYDLVVSVKNSSAKINKQSEEILKWNDVHKNLNKDKDRLKLNLTNETNKSEDLKIKIKTYDSKLTSLNNEVKIMKKDVSQLQHAISLQKLKHEHESRRKDVTISSLKSKLYQLHSNEGSQVIELTKSNGSKTVLNDQYDKILDRYVCELHNNIQILLEENYKYRILIEGIYEKLIIELVTCQDIRWVNLSGLPSHLAMATMEEAFGVFFRSIEESHCNEGRESKLI